MVSQNDVTRILQRVGEGEHDAINALFPLVYDELRRLAARHMRRERSDHTLQATALVHDVYVKLVDQNSVDWHGRTHFLAVAAQQMRRILVDHARRRAREKRGGDRQKTPAHELDAITPGPKTDILALNEAMSELESFDPRAAKIVELRYFAGMTNREIARALGVSRSTVDRSWDLARRWLYVQLHKGDTDTIRNPDDGPRTMGEGKGDL